MVINATFSHIKRMVDGGTFVFTQACFLSSLLPLYINNFHNICNILQAELFAGFKVEDLCSESWRYQYWTWLNCMFYAGAFVFGYVQYVYQCVMCSQQNIVPKGPRIETFYVFRAKILINWRNFHVPFPIQIKPDKKFVKIWNSQFSRIQNCIFPTNFHRNRNFPLNFRKD